MEDLKKTYDRIAHDWHEDHRSDTWWHRGTDRFLALVPQGGTVLDLGCGAGHASEYLVRKGYRVTGADFSDAMIRIARQEVPDAEFQVLDLYDIGTIGKTFDAVYAKAVLLHVPKKDIVDVLGNIKTALKPGGYLFLALKENRPGQQDERIETENDYGYEYSRPFSYFTTDEVLHDLREAGYEIVWNDVANSGNTNWIQVTARANA